MKLKRTYSITVDPDIAELIEKIHLSTGKSYIDIFIEALKEKYKEENKD